MSNVNDIVITGIGIVTRQGLGTQANISALDKENDNVFNSLEKFPSHNHLSDRRLMKAVSAAHGYGIVAFEDSLKAANWTKGIYAEERVGIYVGAAPSLCRDNENFREAVALTQENGVCDESKFGSTFMTARPTTLLLGLPNNVFCYASIIADARGANSNYTAQEVSAHLALKNAWRNIQRKRLDCAIAGGFSVGMDDVHVAMRKMNDMQLQAADGAVFAVLERREAAVSRNATPLASIHGIALANDGKATIAKDRDPATLAATIQQVIEQSGIDASQIGLVMLSATGDANLDQCEFKSVSSVFAKAEKPALATASRLWGHMIESGGMGEVMIANHLYKIGELIPGVYVQNASAYSQEGFARRVDTNKPYTLITRTSPWGDCSCVLIRQE